MSTEETDEQSGGGPVHSFGNTLAWSWSREMPRALKGGFLTLLYALRAMAYKNGQLRFKDGTVIRIQDIAKAAGCREQDARRYLEAAIRAGLIVVVGDRRRGIATLYQLVCNRWPDWKAAEHYLKSTARTRKEEGDSEADGSGHSGTNSDDEGSVHSGTNQFGPQRHEPLASDAEPVRSTVARPGSVHSGANGSVHSGPNITGVTHGVTHVEVAVVPQPQVVGGSGEQTDEKSTELEDEPPFGRCEVCGKALVRLGDPRCADHREKPLPRHRRGTRRQQAVQPPIIAVVPDIPDEPATSRGPGFRWKPDDPTAARRVCGCGRTFQLHGDKTCQDCQHAAYQEAKTA